MKQEAKHTLDRGTKPMTATKEVQADIALSIFASPKHEMADRARARDIILQIAREADSAPELLAACEALLAEAQKEREATSWSSIALDARIGMLQSAIAKAKGGAA